MSLVCRYLRTVMLKYPPPNWRVIRLDSLEKRTAEDMTKFTEYERLQGCCRLEVGCFNFANMFKDEDLMRVFANLKNLTSMKLFWCHLLRGEGFAMSQGLPGALRLRELRLHKCRADARAIVAGCPNLISLGLSDCEVVGGAEFGKLRELKRLMLIDSGPTVWVKEATRLTHLWLAPAPPTLESYIACMPGLRMCVRSTNRLEGPALKLPLVDFYDPATLLPQQGYDFSWGRADWELFPQV